MRLLILAFALAATAAHAETGFQDLTALDRQIAEATGGRAEPLDRRLRLKTCTEALSISATGPAPGVRCGAAGWRIALRLNGAAAYSTSNGPVAIRRGDEVTVTIEGRGFELTGSGIAMDDGHEGGTVRVKTSTTSTPVSVRVTGPGTASLKG